MDSDQEVKAGMPPPESPFSLADLERISNELREKLHDITMAKGSDYAESHLTQQQAYEDFINDQLKNNKDRYDHIFKTEPGSIYFTTISGESLRIRMDEERGWQLQFPERRIIFVDEEERIRLRGLVNDRHFPRNFDGQSIRKTSFGIGAVPIEFGIVEHAKRVAQLTPFTETLGSLTFGEQSLDTDLMTNGFHRGHPITQIIK